MLVFPQTWCALFSCNKRFKIRPFLPYYQSNIRTKPKLGNDIKTFIYVNNVKSVLHMTQLCYKQRDKMRPCGLKHIVPELEIEEN